MTIKHAAQAAERDAMLLELVAASPQGIRSADMAARTGIKERSIVNAMQRPALAHITSVRECHTALWCLPEHARAIRAELKRKSALILAEAKRRKAEAQTLRNRARRAAANPYPTTYWLESFDRRQLPGGLPVSAVWDLGRMGAMQ
jgi:uncharacterized membrane protein YqiK